ncbi:6-bladed beta-propeller protein [Bacteroides faecichinchillae]|uniref:6-bladed beta-propeller protein n=1 Tax=Bacteroides faecichinchillae TaxID=871325 RepID=A0A1M4ZB55_9BACE|nr:6-bladed beta-propeller [Bacteroides faecichinchillae]THG68321.1 6-bladed beta-propeller [Bacteroides faecichinchillae]SHF15215.1 6-bladed beta-propeller protein [Bacteroides faecichinchillae]
MYRSINMSILGIILLTLLLSCTGPSSQSLSNELIEIDVKKEYPKKDIVLNDIAEITYIPLETNDSSVMHPNFEMSLSTDIIIAGDNFQSKLFFFNKKGSYLGGFKRCCGQSGEEYNRLSLFTVDYTQKELYVYDRFFLSRILVYDFSGNFKRRIRLPKQVWLRHLYVYDDKNLIGYSKWSWHGKFDGKSDIVEQNPYYFIDRQTGAMRPVPITIKKRICDDVKFRDEKTGEIMLTSLYMDPMLKTKDGFIIADPSLDTVYHYVNNVLIPVAIFKNRDMEENLVDLHSVKFCTDRYLLLEVQKKEVDYDHKTLVEHPNRLLFCDRETQEISEATLYISDKISKLRTDSYDVSEVPDNMFVTLFAVDYLKWLLEQGSLKGELKKIAESLDEEANSVMMVARFKQ